MVHNTSRKWGPPKSPFFLIEQASSEVWMVLGGLPDDIKIVTNNKVHDDDEVWKMCKWKSTWCTETSLCFELDFFLREMKLDFQNGGRSDHVAHFHMNITFDDNLSAPVIFVQLFSRCANQYPSSFKIAVWPPPEKERTLHTVPGKIQKWTFLSKQNSIAKIDFT